MSFNASYSLVYGETSSISSFVLVCGKVRFFQPSELVVDDCKLVLLFGVCPGSMFHLRRLRWVAIVVFKALVGERVCRWPSPLLPVQCMFQAPSAVDRQEEEDDLYEFHCIYILYWPCWV